MKKILFLLFILLSLTGCKDQQVVIHGVESINFDFAAEMYYVQLEGESYEVKRVRLSHRNIAPETDMLVTCFTVGDGSDMQFIQGRKSIEEIEDAFSVGWVFLVSFAVLAIMLAVWVVASKFPLVE